MRTASEIRIEYMLKTGGLCSSNIEAAINTARREALEEAAERVDLQSQYGYGTLENKLTSSFETKDKVERTSYGHGDSGYEVVTVNKQSILNLINELK